MLCALASVGQSLYTVHTAALQCSPGQPAVAVRTLTANTLSVARPLGNKYDEENRHSHQQLTDKEEQSVVEHETLCKVVERDTYL